MNFEYSNWNEEASIINVFFSEKFMSKTGMPIFPPKTLGTPFFVKIWFINLQVVDLPLVPVTTIDFIFLFLKYSKSKSVIILFLFLINSFLKIVLSILIPGLKII